MNESVLATDYTNLNEIDFMAAVDMGNNKLPKFEVKIITSIFAILIILGKYFSLDEI